MVDIRNLLAVPADEMKKPPVWPRGSYHGYIEKYESGESKEKKTPFLRVFFRVQSADATIPAEQMEGIDVTKRNFRKDFYLMEDRSQHWRLVEFLKAIGIETEGRGLDACVPEMVMKPVMMEITQRANNEGTELFNEVGAVTAPPA